MSSNQHDVEHQTRNRQKKQRRNAPARLGAFRGELEKASDCNQSERGDEDPVLVRVKERVDVLAREQQNRSARRHSRQGGKRQSRQGQTAAEDMQTDHRRVRDVRFPPSPFQATGRREIGVTL